MGQMELMEKRFGTNNRELALEHGISLVDRFVNKNYLIDIDKNPVQALKDVDKSFVSMRFFQIEQIMYNQSENINDKLISVFSALQDVKSALLMMIDGDENGVRFYIGVRSKENVSTAGKILEKSFLGNFQGSRTKALKTCEIEALMQKMVMSEGVKSPKNVACVSLVPAARDENKDSYVQGMEKFMDTMQGSRYTALFIASPVEKHVLQQRKKGLEELYSTISSFSKITLTYGTNYSEAVSKGTFQSFAKSVASSISNATAHADGQSHSFSSGQSDNYGFGYGGFSSGSGRSYSQTDGYSSTNSWSRTVTDSISDTDARGENQNYSKTNGDSKSMAISYDNKTVQGMMQKLDEQLQRIQNCETYGLWDSAAYFISQDVQTVTVAANTYKALIAGEKSSVENSYTNLWGIKSTDNACKVLDYMCYGMHPVISIQSFEDMLSHEVIPTSLISGKELPIMFHLPRKSVNGLIVMDMAEFGRNVFSKENPHKRVIEIGQISHMGKTEDTKVVLDVDSFSSHCFITGSTGAGKSNTSYRILDEMLRNGVKFLVIEPAKGEYKKAFGALEGIHIFCTNPKEYRMLHINPFEFQEEVHILEHLERLIEIFSACWPLYGAMPAILKESVEKTYEKAGWDLANSIHIPNGKRKFPNFADLLEMLPQVIQQTAYSKEARSDYQGALVTRVKSLACGISGQIFCSNSSVSDEILFDENTIIDLSRIGSAETKSLIMGILIMKLNEYRMSKTEGENLSLRHVTVLEEAHNILRRTSMEQSQEGANLMGKSVEMISNSIAEMRTYGEGFMIIDQSPTAVDISAIKNTNTKIIMRLPELADCEAIGSAIALEENQIRELSRLGQGKAVIMQNDWLEAVLTSVYYWGNKYAAPIQITDYEMVKVVRGEIAKEILRQRRQRILEKESLIAIVSQSQLSVAKKNEYMDCIKEGVRSSMKARQIAAFLRELLGTEGLFQVVPFPRKLMIKNIGVRKTEEYRIEAERWGMQMLEAAKYYYRMDNEKDASEIMRYLIYDKAMCFEEDSRYIFAYRLLFE